MRFDKYFPTGQLRLYIKYYIVSEAGIEREYKVFPSPGIVVGFQFKGNLAVIKNNSEVALKSAGITGISDHYQLFKNSSNIGTVLVYFTEMGFAHFSSIPANTFFNLSIALDDIFDKDEINRVEEKLVTACNDNQRINIVEEFLHNQINGIEIDKLIVKTIKMIYNSKGTIRIKDLSERLNISQSSLEKRFRNVVGTSPKKFASIIRFNQVLYNMGETKTLIEICYENNFFDQAHFIKDFKQFAGDTPENYISML